MTVIISAPVMNILPQATVLTDLDDIIEWAIQARSNAHGNDERQAELNDILNRAYDEKWGKKKH